MERLAIHKRALEDFKAHDDPHIFAQISLEQSLIRRQSVNLGPFDVPPRDNRRYVPPKNDAKVFLTPDDADEEEHYGFDMSEFI